MLLLSSALEHLQDAWLVGQILGKETWSNGPGWRRVGTRWRRCLANRGWIVVIPGSGREGLAWEAAWAGEGQHVSVFGVDSAFCFIASSKFLMCR